MEQKLLASRHLRRPVTVDVFRPKTISSSEPLSLLILNDGQNLEEMAFAPMLNGLLASGQVQPLLCAGIHCSQDRIEEYGTAATPDFAGRGKKAAAYQQFLVNELLPFLQAEYGIGSFAQKAIAGFSMGGLSAIDTLFNHPEVFDAAGVFSGSLWWRSKDLDEDYDDHRDRIMHQQVRSKGCRPRKRFYFTTGSLDETADRNQNGIIDSIDDTLDLIGELEGLGYNRESDIFYYNDESGRHDMATWARALPQFLLWLVSPLAADLSLSKDKEGVKT